MNASPLSAQQRQGLKDAATWVFDLDNTLYPASSRLFDQVDQRMTAFVAEFLAVDAVEARKIQKKYFRAYGTTMRGLMDRHGLDPADFLAYVHDIDLAPIAPCPMMTRALKDLPGRKVIFTNGSVDHADRITRHLGIREVFDGIFDIVASDYVPKPAPHVYDSMIERHDIDPSRAVMVEDMAKNLLPAAAMGMTTVWVRTDSEWAGDGADGDHVHHVVDDLSAWLADVAGRDC